MKSKVNLTYLILLALVIALPTQLTARGLLWLGTKLIDGAKALEAWKYQFYVTHVRPLYEKEGINE